VGESKSFLLRLGVLVAALAVAAACALASASAVGIETRALLLAQRFTPDRAPSSSKLAERLIALRGETEGFQLAVRSPGGRLHAELSRGTDELLRGSVRILRVGFVTVTKPSSGVGFGPGRYADPLPRQVPSGLETTAGKWGGFVVLVDVPRDARPGVYRGAVDVKGPRGDVLTSHPFSVRVSTVRAIPRTDRRSFRALGGFTTGWYLASAPIPNPERDAGARLQRQYRNLVNFFAEHYMTPMSWDYGRPNRLGRYGEGTSDWSRSPVFVRDYNEAPLPAKLLPARGDDFGLARDWRSAGATYLSNVAAYWRAHGWLGDSTYLLVADEPSNAAEREELPAINRLVHEQARGVKTIATAFPYDRTPARTLCRRFGSRSCVIFRGVVNSNRKLWNGGSDDLDAWAVATNRYYGRYTAGLERAYGIDHARDTWKHLQRVRRRAEVWSYTYFMPTRSIPQLTIDGPPTDPRLLFLWNAYEQNRGWLVWHVARWVDGANYSRRTARAASRNPYVDPLSSTTQRGEVANGDVSLIYPPVSQQYDLTDALAPPVTSLRFETLRDGIEDVNLVTLYRERYGQRAVKAALGRIFGKVAVGARVGYTWPRYSNAGLAVRMERVRRALIFALER
jgi:hypothetical protein